MRGSRRRVFQGWVVLVVLAGLAGRWLVSPVPAFAAGGEFADVSMVLSTISGSLDELAGLDGSALAQELPGALAGVESALASAINAVGSGGAGPLAAALGAAQADVASGLAAPDPSDGFGEFERAETEVVLAEAFAAGAGCTSAAAACGPAVTGTALAGLSAAAQDAASALGAECVALPALGVTGCGAGAVAEFTATISALRQAMHAVTNAALTDGCVPGASSPCAPGHTGFLAAAGLGLASDALHALALATEVGVDAAVAAGPGPAGVLCPALQSVTASGACPNAAPGPIWPVLTTIGMAGLALLSTGLSATTCATVGCPTPATDASAAVAAALTASQPLAALSADLVQEIDQTVLVDPTQTSMGPQAAPASVCADCGPIGSLVGEARHLLEAVAAAAARAERDLQAVAVSGPCSSVAACAAGVLATAQVALAEARAADGEIRAKVAALAALAAAKGVALCDTLLTDTGAGTCTDPDLAGLLARVHDVVSAAEAVLVTLVAPLPSPADLEGDLAALTATAQADLARLRTSAAGRLATLAAAAGAAVAQLRTDAATLVANQCTVAEVDGASLCDPGTPARLLELTETEVSDLRAAASALVDSDVATAVRAAESAAASATAAASAAQTTARALAAAAAAQGASFCAAAMADLAPGATCSASGAADFLTQAESNAAGVVALAGELLAQSCLAGSGGADCAPQPPQSLLSEVNAQLGPTDAAQETLLGFSACAAVEECAALSASLAPLPVDPLLPPSPRGVSAEGLDRKAYVSWTPGSASTPGLPTTSYTVVVIPTNQTVQVVAPVDAANPEDPIAPPTYAFVPGLIPGRNYQFTVTANDLVGTSVPSARSPVTEVAGPPDAPTGVSATGGDAQASVSWTAASNNGAPITSYTVTAYPGGAQAQVGGGSLAATVPGLTNGQSYTFRVQATNAYGTSPASAPSNAVTPEGGPSGYPGSSASVYVGDPSALYPDGCTEGTNQSESSQGNGFPTRGLVILDFGVQVADGQTLSTANNGTSYSYAQIESMAMSYLEGLASCGGRDTIVALGTSNSLAPTGLIEDDQGAAAGSQWGSLVADVTQQASANAAVRAAGEQVAGAIDAEDGNSWSGPGQTLPWAQAYANAAAGIPYYDFGSPGGCPQTGSSATPGSCKNGWTQASMWTMAAGTFYDGTQVAQALPEVYECCIELSWQQLAIFGYDAYGEHMYFAGAESQYPGGGRTPQQAWQALWCALNGKKYAPLDTAPYYYPSGYDPNVAQAVIPYVTDI